MVDQQVRGLNLGEFSPLSQLLLVTPDIFEGVWPQVEHIFLEHENAEFGWGEYYTLEFIKAAIKQAYMQLWVVNNEEEFFYVVLTELIRYPKKTIIHTVWSGGSDIKEAVKVWDWMEVWASKQGAQKSVGFAPRPGILRMLKPLGYRQVAVAFEKDISGIREH